METLGPASETDAVNELLASVGEDPVEALDNLPPSGNMALKVLRAVSRDFQEEGHWFNTVTQTLSPTTGGKIPVPTGTLDLDGTDTDAAADFDTGYIFNRADRTYVWEAATEFEVIYHRSWAELPSVARRYITALAVERFVESFPGAEPTSPSRQRNLLRAQVAFKKAVIRNSDLNILNNTSIQTLVRR
jgi:hypothetical protein